VRRTLQPLAYDPPARDDGAPDDDAPLARWAPRAPERILALTVCDPAIGSGTFAVAALRFLTEALERALWAHGWLEATADGGLALGPAARQADAPAWLVEAVRDLPLDREETARARLKRLVVERCVYGWTSTLSPSSWRSWRSGSRRWTPRSPSASSTTS
jgi:hypothetical protein